MRYVHLPTYNTSCNIHHVFLKDSSDDMSDADTEETLIHPISSDDSDSDGDGTDAESLASSVAELSSGVCWLYY